MQLFPCNRPPSDNERPIAEPERIVQLALQPRSLGSEIDVIDGVAILGELHDELVEGLADDRRRGATLRGCLDVCVSRVMCVFNPAIRIAAGHLFIGVHSGAVGDGVADLMEAGIVDNRHKEIDPGVTTTTRCRWHVSARSSTRSSTKPRYGTAGWRRCRSPTQPTNSSNCAPWSARALPVRPGTCAARCGKSWLGFSRPNIIGHRHCRGPKSHPRAGLPA